MKKAFTRLFLINKRLLKTVSFLALLILIPLTALSLSFMRTKEKGVLTIALSAEDPDDAGAQRLIAGLLENAGILRMVPTDSPDGAKGLVDHNMADAAWIITDHYEENIERSASGNPVCVVKIYTQEDNVYMKLSREKLFAALYPDLSRQLFRTFIEKNTDSTGSSPMPYYDRYSFSGDLVRFSFAESGQDARAAVSGDYLLLPLRGMLSLLIFAAGLIAAVCFGQDARDGAFTWLSAPGRAYTALFYEGSAVFWTALFSLFALYFSGTFTAPQRECLLMLLYAISVSVQCDLLRRLFRHPELIASLIPPLLLLAAGLCPIFLDAGRFKPLSALFPAFHYLHAANSTSYVFRLLLCAVLYTAADLAAYTVFRHFERYV